MSTDSLRKIDRALQTLPAGDGEMIDVIVSIARVDAPAAAPPPDRAAHVAQAQARFDAAAAPLLARLNALGAERARPLWIAHAVAARLPRAALAALAAEEMVARIVPDTERKMI